jgi:hypothetical protein
LPTRNTMCMLQNPAQISTPRRRLDYDAYIKGRLEGRYVVTYIDDEVTVIEAEPIALIDDIKAAAEDIEESLLRLLYPYKIKLPYVNIYVVNNYQCDDLFRTASLSDSMYRSCVVGTNCRGGPTISA